MSAQFVFMNGLLTQSELAFYWENGYLVKHELFSSDEVRQLSEAAGERSLRITYMVVVPLRKLTFFAVRGRPNA